MNLLIDDRISGTRDFANQFVLFPTRCGRENRGEEPVSRLSRDQLEAFLKAESAKLSSTHFFAPPPEPPKPTPEKDLAAGVLKQAAYDLRRFRAATTGVKREIYLDAYSWINANDFSWPYSFLNVCKLLDLCPEVIRAELLSDASLSCVDYWVRRAGRLSRSDGRPQARSVSRIQHGFIQFRRRMERTPSKGLPQKRMIARATIVLINERFAI
ncbi:MAG: hypothetical protein DME54_15585 [Verrucomicrobia bacterium]|nr:MAG: hypothetical protein DME54_15585 [Verrucomicrobiota bacterium]